MELHERIADSEPQQRPEDHAPLALAEIHRRLLERAKRKIGVAERIATLILAGYTHAEIQAKLGVDDMLYQRAAEWLADALRDQREDDAERS